MAEYNVSNLAHELELPDENGRQEREQQEDKAVREEERRAKARPEPAMSIKSKVAWGLLMLIAMTLMGSLIYGRVEISRLYNERAGLERELGQLQNENVGMQSEIAERMNMKKVEEYARNDLGLQKLDKSQIEYIEVETPSVAEVKQDNEEDIFVRIKHWFNHVTEYIGL